ncbi:hypothetical protein H5410_056296 [Solanum commersonii]|uniref:Uncharacterized protein n=1 Tax=Solanum commersonii TaxID=4109 RepID=A0A9J5WKW7_SOLCO|nr:hypothetical protein H5410_056296 [Solanum commersonii]
MGYIKLACPRTHVWYLKHLPSYIANLLDKPLKELEGLVYAMRKCYPRTISRSRFMNYYREFVGRMGRIRGRRAHGNEWEDRKVGRRKDFWLDVWNWLSILFNKYRAEWMVLCLLPLLPPEVETDHSDRWGKLMSSDINELYRRVIYLNNTLTDLLTTSRSTPEN